MVNPRKVYSFDTGFISVFERAGRRNVGHALETAVLLELTRQGHDVAYVRSAAGSEVDFLAVDHEHRATLIQVCADLGDSATLRREVHGLMTAREAHRHAAMLIVAHHAAVAKPVPASIEVVPATTWLLEGV
jgi:predicted AAA+ superfamily ATPase